MKEKIISLILPLILLTIVTVQTISVSYVVTVETDKIKYHRYEVVYITVTITENGNPVKGVVVGIQVDDPDGNPIYVEQGTTDDNGKVSFHFTVGDPCCPAKYGWYNVTASTPGGKATTKFQVVPRPPVGGKIEKIDKIELLSLLIMDNLGPIILTAAIIFIICCTIKMFSHKEK
ncbi:MAG: hypothetical protein LWW95_11985 [Candidatus Desulfofervidus auxilii]|nr:hypothetical protein [Candidatus Desulfofervidus auxilii]